MFRLKLLVLVLSALQIFALPEYIENLDHDLAVLPEKYFPIVHDYLSKRATNDESAYCCKNWQYINKDEVVTGIQTVSVPKTHTVIVGYRDCNGNVNSTGASVPIQSTTRRLPIYLGPTTSGGLVPSVTGCTWTPIYNTETYMSTEYQTVTYLVPNSHTYCAPEDYSCCSGYVMLNNNCIQQSAVSGLEFLLQLGLIGGIGK